MQFATCLATVLAVILPIAICGLLFCRVVKNQQTDWKLATCLSGLAVVTSLLLLVAAEKVAFVGFDKAVLQVNQKAQQVEALTEQNKRIAEATVAAITHGLTGVLVTEGVNRAAFEKSLENLLKQADVPQQEIGKMLGLTNSTPKPH